MTIYYSDRGVTLYHGDARDGLPIYAESLIVDPVWPNNRVFDIDPFDTLRSILCHANNTRIVVHLGCDSDPRFLMTVPSRYKFLRTCWLRYACPSYKGRVLYTSDVAYVFGEWPKSIPGKRVFPGEITSAVSDKLFHTSNGRNKAFTRKLASNLHPSPRRSEHVHWLISRFGGTSVIDPCAGSGTTLLCARSIGIPAFGVEIEEKYCEFAAKRLEAQQL